ncbi:unnamed protein product [Allacma fusca]|uniref:Uncharacterized protein n=1 Tax=Allacma fusca TaxID=39272 RepID=A0A8J2LDN5_9HEXA|nr:unnamed protein product [Allacma fusca]
MIVQQGPLTDFEKGIFCDNKIDDDREIVNDDLILRLQQLHEELTVKAESQKAIESELFNKVVLNRSKIEKDENTFFEFTNARVGIIETLKNLHREQTIAIESRNRWISKSILEIREELLEIWKQCMVMNAEGANFPEFYSMDFSEDLLGRHQSELEIWKDHHTKFQVLINQIEKRTRLWVRVRELQAKSEDPNRFSNRGASLLKGQKELNSATNTLLKIEEKLVQMADNFESENGRKLLISGLQMSELIKQDWANFEEGIIKRGLRPPLLKPGPTGWSVLKSAGSKLTASQSLPDIAAKVSSRSGSRGVTPSPAEKQAE